MRIAAVFDAYSVALSVAEVAAIPEAAAFSIGDMASTVA